MASKKIKTIFFKIIKYLFILLATYFLTAFIFSLIPTFPKKIFCENKKEIYLTTNGIHLDIIIPKNHLSAELKNGLAFHNQSKYIAFGWGDKGFYLETPTWNDLKFSTAFSAMFLKGESAMHISQYFKSYPDWEKVELCPEQLEQMMLFINSSFKMNEEGEKLKIATPGYFKYDCFYEAKGSYSILKTCNIWVNQALKAAHVKTAVWSPFDVGVLFHLEQT